LQRAGCRECGGTSICQHNLRRSSCRECKDLVPLPAKEKPLAESAASSDRKPQPN
jgi:hypothetical protein